MIKIHVDWSSECILETDHNKTGNGMGNNIKLGTIKTSFNNGRCTEGSAGGVL